MSDTPQESEFDITTSAQIERTYRVKAADAESAHRRLRTHIADPDMLRAGLVSKTTWKDTTPERVKGEVVAVATPKPRTDQATPPAKDK